MYAAAQPPVARRRLARRVRLLRIARGWSQEVLAGVSGLHRTYIGSVERAERNISLDNIERIAHALGIPIRDLLTEPEGTTRWRHRCSPRSADTVSNPCPGAVTAPIRNRCSNTCAAVVSSSSTADPQSRRDS